MAILVYHLIFERGCWWIGLKADVSSKFLTQVSLLSDLTGELQMSAHFVLFPGLFGFSIMENFSKVLSGGRVTQDLCNLRDGLET